MICHAFPTLMCLTANSFRGSVQFCILSSGFDTSASCNIPPNLTTNEPAKSSETVKILTQFVIRKCLILSLQLSKPNLNLVLIPQERTSSKPFCESLCKLPLKRSSKSPLLCSILNEISLLSQPIRKVHQE